MVKPLKEEPKLKKKKISNRRRSVSISDAIISKKQYNDFFDKHRNLEKKDWDKLLKEISSRLLNGKKRTFRQYMYEKSLESRISIKA